MNLAPLFCEHLAQRMKDGEAAMDRTGFETLVISSGVQFEYFADDREAPFYGTPHFLHWCPLEGPQHLLKIQPGKKPILIQYAPEDFWYLQTPLGSPFWADGFDLIECGTVDEVWAALGACPKAAYIGDEPKRAEAAGLEVNPENITKHLDWTRSFKSPYELACMDEAQQMGARGHRAAKMAFLDGASELEIHWAYIQAVGCVDADLPYTTIVALNEMGAILHYHGKRKDVRNGATLLLDAGARYNVNASDITRTFTAPHCDPRFVSLLASMEQMQQELCNMVKPGLHYGEFHHQAHFKTADILLEQGILSGTDREEAVANGYTKPFFPHGLGHHLGIQVHDVAGKQLGPDGTPAPQPPEHPFLRTTRMIEEGNVFTVEPGLYFIPMLLRPFRTGDKIEHSSKFNWALIDALAPFGGIRIEDNLLVTEGGHHNLTRKHLPE